MSIKGGGLPRECMKTRGLNYYNDDGDVFTGGRPEVLARLVDFVCAEADSGVRRDQVRSKFLEELCEVEVSYSACYSMEGLGGCMSPEEYLGATSDRVKEEDEGNGYLILIKCMMLDYLSAGYKLSDIALYVWDMVCVAQFDAISRVAEVEKHQARCRAPITPAGQDSDGHSHRGLQKIVIESCRNQGVYLELNGERMTGSSRVTVDAEGVWVEEGLHVMSCSPRRLFRGSRLRAGNNAALVEVRVTSRNTISLRKNGRGLNVRVCCSEPWKYSTAEETQDVIDQEMMRQLRAIVSSGLVVPRYDRYTDGLRVYVAVLNGGQLSGGQQVTAGAHAMCSATLAWEREESLDWMLWKMFSFRKVSLGASRDELAVLGQVPKAITSTESRMRDIEVAVALPPRNYRETPLELAGLNDDGTMLDVTKMPVL